MRQQSYRHHESSGKGIGGVALVIIAVVAGALLVYACISWFRSDNNEKEESAASVVAKDADDTLAKTADVYATATMLNMSGTSAGVLSRSGTVEVPAYSMVLSLPGVVGDAYEVWMVEAGLADVKSVGALEARADGSFAKTFTIADPLKYPEVFIMLEPNDGNIEPSGNIVAKGKFE